MQLETGSAQGLSAVSAVFGHPKQCNLANILRIDCLLETSRGRLFAKVVKSVVSAVKEAAQPPPAPAEEMQPYHLVKIAGDGRCGWRGILASGDFSSFISVPRSGLQYVCLGQINRHSILDFS